MFDLHPALSSLIFVSIYFLLLALFPVLGFIGFALWGPVGVVAGCILAAFILLWVVCWAIAS